LRQTARLPQIELDLAAIGNRWREFIPEAPMSTATSPFYHPNSITLSENEQRKYSLSRAIMRHADRMDGAQVNCFELELSDQIAKSLPADVKSNGGIFVPWSIRLDAASAKRAEDRARAGLDSKTTTKGKEVVFTEPGQFIEFLYNRLVVKALGARTLSGLQGNIAFPRQTGKATGSWVAENPGTDVADSNLTLDQVVMSPKTYQSSTSYSRQFLAQAQSVADIDNLVRSDLATDSALALDKAALVGDGTGNSPKGVLSTTGTQSYVLKSDTGTGGKPVYDDIVGMESMMEEVNADGLRGTLGWVTAPSIKAILRATSSLGNTIGIPVWQSGDTIDGYMAKVSNQLPKNLTKGLGTNLTVMILGIWSQMIIGLWGSGYELVVDPYRLKKQGMVELTSFVMADVGILQPSAFVYANDVAKV
jgi:HK97 family phage major capsid protein